MNADNHFVVLLIGGNLGDRLQNMLRAQQLIAFKIGVVKKSSRIYQSAPWGFDDEKDFLNQVLLVHTTKSPVEVLDACHVIEDCFDRKRNPDFYISRTMDVDILFYNDEMIEQDNLSIPHPHLHKRRFTLEPLNELLPHHIHPLLKKTIKDLLDDCEDKSEVHIFDASKKA